MNRPHLVACAALLLVMLTACRSSVRPDGEFRDVSPEPLQQPAGPGGLNRIEGVSSDTAVERVRMRDQGLLCVTVTRPGGATSDVYVRVKEARLPGTMTLVSDTEVIGPFSLVHPWLPVDGAVYGLSVVGTLSRQAIGSGDELVWFLDPTAIEVVERHGTAATLSEEFGLQGECEDLAHDAAARHTVDLSAARSLRARANTEGDADLRAHLLYCILIALRYAEQWREAMEVMEEMGEPAATGK